MSVWGIRFVGPTHAATNTGLVDVILDAVLVPYEYLLGDVYRGTHHEGPWDPTLRAHGTSR